MLMLLKLSESPVLGLEATLLLLNRVYHALSAKRRFARRKQKITACDGDSIESANPNNGRVRIKG